MLIGHKTQWDFLKKIARVERVPQAMIFTGVDSLGKRKVALEFVKLLNCETILQNFETLPQEPCQNCLSCKLIEKGQYPDLILLSPEKKDSNPQMGHSASRALIQISQIRELQKALNLRPQLSVFKSVIIDNSETLNSESQNCLLKTLEEPKGNSLLILITSRIESLFETIRSRCQILKFYPLSPQELEENFKTQVPRAQLQKIFLVSQGRPGRILDFLKDSQKFSKELKIFKEIERLLESDLPEKFSFSQNFFKKENSSIDLNYFLETFENYLRLTFLKKMGVGNEIFDSLNLKTPENYSILKIKQAIDSVENLKLLTSKTNINPKLAFENLMIVLS